jgi:hypothetical protein
MNRAQLRAAVKSRLRIPSGGDARLDDASIHECISLALNDICEARHWPWMLNTATLTFAAGLAPLPTDWAHSSELFVNGRRAKRASSVGQFLDIATDLSGCVWMEVGANVQLTPVPSATLTTPTLYYYRAEPALTVENQSPLLPSIHHNTLICGAAYHANMRRGEMEKATQDLGEFNVGIKRLIASVPTRSGPKVIRSAGTSMWAVWN